MWTKLLTRLQRFAEDTRGNMAIEAVIWLPLILGVLSAMFSLHDTYRYKGLNTKAAYTISDALSRETDPIDDAYLDGMVDVLEFLTISEGPYSLRVTLVRYDGDTTNANGTINVGEGYTVEWSQVRGNFTALDNAMLAEAKAELPIMLHNERVILVETRTDYVPPYIVPGLTATDMFYTYGFTRPRFAPKIVWKDADQVASTN
ncbi:TadE/TadG family type IV pilus assembly protein [Sagittula sp. S175]|uniref:TadE/TadG family type IV pilus assembly protein n=1 Tax=Sagittula sp. S175 TaxID=3415129 RepID=UPI003C7CE203